MQQCNKNVENGLNNIVSQSITSSVDAQAFSAFSTLIIYGLDFILMHQKIKSMSTCSTPTLL